MSNDPKVSKVQVEHQVVAGQTSDTAFIDRMTRGMDDLTALGYRLHSTALNDRGLLVAVMTRDAAK